MEFEKVKINKKFVENYVIKKENGKVEIK